LPKAKILVVDDEPGILNLLNAYLRQEGYSVYEARDGVSAIKAARAFKPDLVILDILLPGIDGLEVLANLRRESQVYIIMLTAKTEEMDRIIGLNMGADDYMTKPFSPRELVARVKAALRRMQSTSSTGSQVLTFAHVKIDSGSRQVWLDEQLVDLTPIEFELLKTLAEHRGLVMGREQLIEKVWGYGEYGETRTIDVHVGHLRRKLGGAYITTIRGVGYRFDDEVI
jgi:two-component system alkaline phosphatase synthesis response regulator PhoP